MDTQIDSEPTCFSKMLHDFRADSIPGRRMSALGFPSLGGIDSQNIAKPVKLVFDDSFLNDTENNFNKKRKVEGDSSDSQKNDSFGLTSSWETRKMKADLAESRSEIVRLQSRISQLEIVHKETVVLFEQEKKRLQQLLEKERDCSKEVEQRMKVLRKHFNDTNQELKDCKAALELEKLNWKEKYQNLLRENMLLKSQFSELDADSGDKVTQLERKLSATEQQVVDVQEELASSKALLSKLLEELNEKRSEARVWEADKAKMFSLEQRVKDLEYERESHQKAIEKAQVQEAKLLRLLDLEKEVSALKEKNKNLRQAITDKLYLESVVDDLRSRLSVLQEREQEIVSLKVDLGVAQTRLQEWAELSYNILGQNTGGPISVRQSFENLQKSEVVLTSENTQLKSRLKKLEESQKDSINESQLLKAEITKLKQIIEQNNTKINRLRKQNSLIAWERNDLRQLVDSCQKEFTVTSSAALDMQHLSRIDALEKALDGYKKRNEQLEKELCENQDQIGGVTVCSDLDSVEFNKLKSERDSLLKEKETLSKKIEELQDQLEYRALKGDFDVRQTRVLHFRANPLSEAASSYTSELEKYQAEIAQLRERVQLLQEGKTHDLTQIVNERVDINVVKEIGELKEKLSSQEKKNQRLNEIFKKTSHEFREVVNLLLGYKIYFSENKYKLYSLYAESPEDNLVFEMNEDGGMDLLGTPFSETVSELIEVYLQQEDSIPMFLSALTMDLFQKHSTLMSINTNPQSEIVISD